jgi:hypothetical protein
MRILSLIQKLKEAYKQEGNSEVILLHSSGKEWFDQHFFKAMDCEIRPIDQEGASAGINSIILKIEEI